MQIRLAQPDEAEVLTDLIMRSKQSNGYDDAFMAQCVDELRQTASELQKGHTWVADDGDLLGCLTLEPIKTAGLAEVSAFFVHPDHKRKGVGRALWNHIHGLATAQGFKRLQLDADPAAVPFYEAIGFCITGSKPSGSIPGRSLPVMEFTL